MRRFEDPLRFPNFNAPFHECYKDLPINTAKSTMRVA